MTNYLKKLLDNNWNVVVKDKYNRYQAFSPYKDSDGDNRTSDWCELKEKAKQYIGYCGYFETDLERYAKHDKWQIVEVYRNTPPIMKVGQKVEILDTIKHTDDWNDDFNVMFGKITIVYNNMDGLSYVVLINGTEELIGADFVIPAREEMQELEEMKKLANDFFTKADKLVKEYK